MKMVRKNTVLDLDDDGNVLAMTFEHASSRSDLREVILEGLAA
jgi:uncharacterized protein YuzE